MQPLTWNAIRTSDDTRKSLCTTFLDIVGQGEEKEVPKSSCLSLFILFPSKFAIKVLQCGAKDLSSCPATCGLCHVSAVQTRYLVIYPFTKLEHGICTSYSYTGRQTFPLHCPLLNFPIICPRSSWQVIKLCKDADEEKEGARETRLNRLRPNQWKSVAEEVKYRDGN